MKIVIDSNVLFSALIKNSLTRRIILEHPEPFLFPSFIFEEMEKHRELLLKKSKMNQNEFNALLRLILMNVVLIPDEVLAPFRNNAVKIIKDIDIDDAIFIACVLAHSGSALWSDDKKLKKQNVVRVLNTPEMKEKQSK